MVPITDKNRKKVLMNTVQGSKNDSDRTAAFIR